MKGARIGVLTTGKLDEGCISFSTGMPMCIEVWGKGNSWPVTRGAGYFILEEEIGVGLLRLLLIRHSRLQGRYRDFGAPESSETFEGLWVNRAVLCYFIGKPGTV